jgi:hypothetical protein
MSILRYGSKCDPFNYRSNLANQLLLPLKEIMTVEELISKFANVDERMHEFEVVIPMEREGDIDEIETYDVTNLTWDTAEKRVILEW